MSMPQYITNITSFGDTVKILKNKGILTESHKNNDKWYEDFQNAISQMGLNPNVETEVMKALDHTDPLTQYGDMPATKAAKEFVDDLGFNENKDKDHEEESSDEELDAILQGIEDEKYGERATKSDVLDEPLEETEELNEAKKKEEKIEYSEHSCNPTELRLGIRTELEKEGVDELDKAKKIAIKNIHKDPVYYTKLKLSGVNAQPKVKDKAPVKKAKKEAVQLVDLVNGMQKVKMPKAEEKKKLKENVDEKMRFQDLPADPEVYKTVKDMKGKIMKATNADGIEFQRGDVVKAFDGEEIKIADFKEEQGKVKALYNKGMFFSSIDIDGLEAPKPTMRPGVDIGKSFEKFKMKDLQEMVHEAINEYFDGRDNLVDPLASEEENK